MADFLDEKRSEIGVRLKELKPLVEEYQRLQAAVAALDGARPVSPSSSVQAAKAKLKKTEKDSPKKNRGRPKGSGMRGAEALAIVKKSPGITIAEIAAKMGIKQNYLYRVLPGLAGDGLVKEFVRSDGKRGWKSADET